MPCKLAAPDRAGGLRARDDESPEFTTRDRAFEPATGCIRTPAAPAHDRLDRNRFAGDGRQQSESLPHRGPLHRPGRYSGTRQRCRPLVDCRAASQSRGGARLDRTRRHVSEPDRRHRRDLCGSVSPLQPHPRKSRRRWVLVGLDSDLRPDRSALGLGDPSMVSDRLARRSHCDGTGAVLSRFESLWRQMGRAHGDSDRDSVVRSGVPVGLLADRHGAGRLAPSDDVPSHHAVRRLVRRIDQHDGRSLSDRLCGTGV